MKRKLTQVEFWIFFVVFIDFVSCVTVHFENKDGGFFLRQFPRQHFTPPPPTSSDLTGSPATNSGTPLSIDRFTVFQSSQPISVRATYGPFSTKQTVPARYVVPDPVPINATGSTIDLQDFATHHLDMSAHIVRSEIPRDSPVLRVLFHTGADPGSRRQVLLNRRHQKVCIVLHATMNTKPTLHAACSPDGEDGVCLAQITIPSSYWPKLPSPDKNGRLGKATKSPPRLLQVSYSVLEPRPDELEECHPKMQLQPSTGLGVVPLVQAKGAYKEMKLTDALMMLVPHPPLFPMSRMHLPMFIDKEKAKLLTAIVVRAKVKSGVKILEVTKSAGATAWNFTADVNPRHTGVTVTLIRKEPSDPEPSTASDGEVLELFSLLVEMSEDSTEAYEGTRIVWSVRFEPHKEDGEIELEVRQMDGRKATTRFEVQKDDIQAVVPISKNWEILNTAVLTGKQVSQAMKIFIVSQAGKAADVTFQASCHSEDDSVLKVSSSCSSVYVDGSEARGSVNGSVLVKYGTYTGLARFTVWMPEFPLDLQVVDTRLSQIKSWRVPELYPSGVKSKRKKRSYGNSWNGVSSIPDDFGNSIDRPVCRLRYQQSPVEVYAHFMASDHESGRVSYLINRRTWLRVTDLVLPLLRVSDPRIASLRGRILQGRSMGRTEVQVLSPITGRVIGAKEIRVVNDKIGITQLTVNVVSGLQLNISPDTSVENGYVAETSVTRKLTAQYQEGLLDIEIEFADDSKTALRDIADTDYHLIVESLDPEVVAFAPMVASHHPRVIAVGEGGGKLLKVTLLLSEECRNVGRPKTKGNGPLAVASADITVDFTSSDLQHRPDILQNDGGSYGSSKSGIFQDLQDILKGNSMQEGSDLEPNVQARQYSAIKNGRKKQSMANMTPLEISMYVLLAAFCCAIFVFVISCVVYASKFKQMEPGVTQGLRAAPINTPLSLNSQKEHRKRETTTNVHEWVWLGRASADMSNRNSTINNQNTNPNTTEIRITTNPLNANYCDPEDCLSTSFSNPNHVELPSSRPSSSARKPIDSTTYSRSSPKVSSHKEDVQMWDKPPPLPPHGVPLQQVNRQSSQPTEPNLEDYRPPVPPHRNLPISVSSSGDNTPQRHYYHNHPLKAQLNKSQQDKENKQPIRSPSRPANGQRISQNGEYARPSDPNKVGRGYTSPQGVEDMKNVFEFDDEPQEKAKESSDELVVLRSPKNRGEEDKIEFVHYPESESSNANVRNSGEIKRATIVGNPMFSADQNQTENATPADLPGLDDLQLDMDYEQIMHYFDNLKESNA